MFENWTDFIICLFCYYFSPTRGWGNSKQCAWNLRRHVPDTKKKGLKKRLYSYVLSYCRAEKKSLFLKKKKW